MLGTGLTMMDITLDLSRRGVKLPLFAVSRHGLLPRDHLAGPPSGSVEPLPAGFEGPPRSVARFTRLLRRHAAARAAAGGDWRDAVAAVRAIAPSLWGGLSRRSAAAFSVTFGGGGTSIATAPPRSRRRHREVCSFRRPVGPGRPRPRILNRRRRGGGDVLPRGAAETVRVHVDRVVNCTGPSTDVRLIGDPLLDALLGRGLLRPDPFGLGIETAADGAVLDAGGRPSRTVYCVGPLLKADRWEATAVPELRGSRRALPSACCPERSRQRGE